MQKIVSWVYDTLKITDESGNDMIVSRFDTKLFVDRSAILK